MDRDIPEQAALPSVFVDHVTSNKSRSIVIDVPTYIYIYMFF